MAEITTLLSDGKFLFSAEEKAQIESELEALKKRIAIVTHPENPENIAKEKTINVIQKENDMKKKNKNQKLRIRRLQRNALCKPYRHSDRRQFLFDCSVLAVF